MSIKIELLEEEIVVLVDLLSRALEDEKIEIRTESNKEAIRSLFCTLSSHPLLGLGKTKDDLVMLERSKAFIENPHENDRAFPMD